MIETRDKKITFWESAMKHFLDQKPTDGWMHEEYLEINPARGVKNPELAQSMRFMADGMEVPTIPRRKWLSFDTSQFGMRTSGGEILYRPDGWTILDINPRHGTFFPRNGGKLLKDFDIELMRYRVLNGAAEE